MNMNESSEKLCVFCENLEFDYDLGSVCPTCGWSDGSRMEMTCKKATGRPKLMEA
jgi:hypothetical protein